MKQVLATNPPGGAAAGSPGRGTPTRGLDAGCELSRRRDPRAAVAGILLLEGSGPAHLGKSAERKPGVSTREGVIEKGPSHASGPGDG